jgi:hypothetical protein
MRAIMEIGAVPEKTQKLFAEWASSSVALLFEPGQFVPPGPKSALVQAARTAAMRKQMAFAAASLFIALSIFQVVAQHFPTRGSAWNVAKESLPLSVLIIGIWLIWSIILAWGLKALGGTRAPEANVLYGLRALSTIYVFSIIVGAVAFLSAGNDWTAFEWGYLSVSSVLFALYVPMIFGPANELKGKHFKWFAAFCMLLAVLRGGIESLAMISNPGVVPVSNRVR